MYHRLTIGGVAMISDERVERNEQEGEERGNRGNLTGVGGGGAGRGGRHARIKGRERGKGRIYSFGICG